MASVEVGDDRLVDPDEVKVPENPRHRQVIELVGTLAGHLLQPDQVCYRDMNWYPLDEGHAVAPDVMVLDASVLQPGAKSYRQADATMKSPTVVVEVPSDTDAWGHFLAKAHRYRRLGVVLYVINLDHQAEDCVMRFGPDDDALVPWTGRPIPELGGLVVDLGDEALVARSPDSRLVASSSEELVAVLEAQRDAAIAERDALSAELERRGFVN